MRRPRLVAIRWALATWIAPGAFLALAKPHGPTGITWGYPATAASALGHVTITGSGWKNGPQG